MRSSVAQLVFGIRQRNSLNIPIKCDRHEMVVDGPPASADDVAYYQRWHKTMCTAQAHRTPSNNICEDEKKTKWRLWKIALEQFSASFFLTFSISDVNCEWKRSEQNRTNAATFVCISWCFYCFFFFAARSFGRSVSFPCSSSSWSCVFSFASHLHIHEWKCPAGKVQSRRRETERVSHFEWNHHQTNKRFE